MYLYYHFPGTKWLLSREFSQVPRLPASVCVPALFSLCICMAGRYREIRKRRCKGLPDALERLVRRRGVVFPIAAELYQVRSVEISLQTSSA